MHPRISIRACVRPLVRLSVGNAFVKNARKNFISPTLLLPFNALGLFRTFYVKIQKKFVFYQIQKLPCILHNRVYNQCEQSTRIQDASLTVYNIHVYACGLFYSAQVPEMSFRVI